MDAQIRSEFGLSTDEYSALLKTLTVRFNVQSIEDVAFLSEEQIHGNDRWEACALRRLYDIATAHIGIEKLHRSCPAPAADHTPAQRTDSAESIHTIFF